MTGYQTFYEHHPATPGTPAARHFRHWLPERQEVCLEAASGLTAEDMHIHYDSAKPSAAEPVQFLKPLGVLSYLRSLGVRSALRAYHAFCDSVQEEELLDRQVLDQLEERLNAVRNACEADNPLHQNLLGQVNRELGICDQLRGYQIWAAGMAGRPLQGRYQENRDYIKQLCYASKIVDNRENMTTGESYNAGNFSFIERIFSAAADTVNARDSREQEEALVQLHLSRLQGIQDDQDAPVALRNVINQILPLTDNIPVKYGQGMKSTTLMKPRRGAFVPGHPYGPAGGGGEHSDLEFGLQRMKETVDTSHGSFLHELTHAAVQRTFHNTPLHLGFALPRRNKREAIIKRFESVYKYRSGMVRKLDRLIQAEKGDVHSPFSKRQLDQISEKLAYGAGQALLGLYALNINDIGDRDPRQKLQDDKKDLFMDMERMFSKRAKRSEGYKVYGSVFMEYDATINQMLLWCHDWNIPQDNPLYAALAEAAQIEVTRRNRAQAL